MQHTFSMPASNETGAGLPFAFEGVALAPGLGAKGFAGEREPLRARVVGGMVQTMGAEEREGKVHGPQCRQGIKNTTF